MSKKEKKSDFIEKFRIKPSVKKKLEEKAEKSYLDFNDFLRVRLELIANEK